MSISAFWQMYDNIIPLILQNTFKLGETVTGVLMAMDNVLALFLLPVFGTLSDKVNTPLGKRMPFILCGTVLAVIFMMFLPVADNGQNLVLFLSALFATLLSLGLYRSPAVALMPDLLKSAWKRYKLVLTYERRPICLECSYLGKGKGFYKDGAFDNSIDMSGGVSPAVPFDDHAQDI